MDRLVAVGAPVRVLREGVLERVGSTRTPQPVLGVVAIPRPVSPAELGSGTVVVTAGVHDPGNLGTIVRSAEAAGAVAVIASNGVDPWNPKVVRASAGAVLGLPVLVVDEVVEVLAGLARRGWRVVAADVASTLDYTDADLRGPIALVVGGETHGLPDAVEAVADEVVHISMSGPTESLNVGVAASILLFEAARQARS
jgi:TrmH family RNA methyltransferase